MSVISQLESKNLRMWPGADIPMLQRYALPSVTFLHESEVWVASHGLKQQMEQPLGILHLLHPLQHT